MFKQCLAEKAPSIKKEDYVACTKQIYDQRVEMLLGHFGEVSGNLFERLNV